MHFYYLDESGCTGQDLVNQEQPIFVAGGIVVRDEGWNQTKERYDYIITKYFNGNPPANFELHSQDLLSPSGNGYFSGHPRDKRNGLVHELLDLLAERKHQTAYVAIDKRKLQPYANNPLNCKPYLNTNSPYLISYDYLISLFEWYTKEKLGRSARGLVIIDMKEQYKDEVNKITNFRRYEITKTKRIRWLSEFTYSVDSKANPMIQLSDMVCYLVRKFLEIEGGYRDTYHSNVKSIYRDFYLKVHQRLLNKGLRFCEELRGIEQYEKMMIDITCIPSRNFSSKRY